MTQTSCLFNLSGNEGKYRKKKTQAWRTKSHLLQTEKASKYGQAYMPLSKAQCYIKKVKRPQHPQESPALKEMTLFANEVYNYWTNDDDHQIRVENLPETII